MAKGRYALVPLFLACSIFGGYATMGAASRNGLGAVLKDVVRGSRSVLLGAPEPFKRCYTGIAAIDAQLSLAVALFSTLIDGDVPPENFAFFVWGMAQFAAGWTIMLLETVRVGNRGRVVSYAGIFGLMVQNISWTITLPVWLSLHLLTSPIADIGQEGSRSTAWKALGVYNPWDTILVPLSVVQAFIVPAVLMSLPPSLLNHSAAAHYGWNAVWQAFPLWNVLILAILRRTPLANDASSSGEERGRPRTKATADPAQEPPSVSCVYNFALVLVISTHVPTLAVSLLPDSLRSFLVSSTPFLSDYLSSLITRGTFVDIFVPQSWPFSPHQLTVVPTAYASGDLAPLAAQFLQYDLLVASVPFFLWALYLRQASTRDANLYDALVKAGLWLVIGGPSGAVIVLLKQRDSDVTEDHNKSAKRFKWL